MSETEAEDNGRVWLDRGGPPPRQRILFCPESKSCKVGGRDQTSPTILRRKGLLAASGPAMLAAGPWHPFSHSWSSSNLYCTPFRGKRPLPASRGARSDPKSVPWLIDAAFRPNLPAESLLCCFFTVLTHHNDSRDVFPPLRRALAHSGEELSTTNGYMT